MRREHTGNDGGWLGRWTYAHRGLHGDGTPENSLTAFVAATQAGLGIELDVQASADGVAMVFHDRTLDRLTTACGELRVRTAVDLGSVELKGGGTIPTFAEALDCVAGRVPILVELKSSHGVPWRDLVRSVANALSTYVGDAAVMSFDPRIVRWFALRLHWRPRGLVTGREAAGTFAFGARRDLAMRLARPDFVACDLRDLPDPVIAKRRAQGMPVLGWTAHDSASRATARRFCDAAIAEGEGLS